MTIPLTPSINFLDEHVCDGGLRFVAMDDFDGDWIFVYDRDGSLEDRLPITDLNPNKTLEEVAHDWMDEHGRG